MVAVPWRAEGGEGTWQQYTLVDEASLVCSSCTSHASMHFHAAFTETPFVHGAGAHRLLSYHRDALGATCSMGGCRLILLSFRKRRPTHSAACRFLCQTV